MSPAVKGELYRWAARLGPTGGFQLARLIAEAFQLSFRGGERLAESLPPLQAQLPLRELDLSDNALGDEVDRVGV